MTLVTTFGHGKFGAQIQLFLACLYCQEQLKAKTLILNGIILILKSILKQHCTRKQSSSFKANGICLD